MKYYLLLLIPILSFSQLDTVMYNGEGRINILYLGDGYRQGESNLFISDVISTCTKNFRFPFIKKILAYEVLSETDFNLNRKKFFFPNHYEDISNFLSKKKNAMKIYKSELKNFPFPRSIKSIDALAKYRGSQIGKKAAESFELLKNIE